jgi:endonuclease YncB( thermonuclease family)
MPFKVIAGTFQVVNYSPDGDSIRFHPANPRHLKGLSGPPAKINRRGDVQLRIEAIDALETHYQSSGGGNYHQPFDLAQQARQRLLDFAGITDVVWDNREMNVTAANDGTPGYILTREVEKYGRPIAFVFAGDPPEADGSKAFLDANRLRDSYNYTALAEGLTFPTYYTGLFSDLRDALTEATAQARAANAGIHARDVTTAGFDADTLATITDDVVILPKLFRRVIDYMVNTGTAVGFKEKLAESQEPVLDLSTANFTHFDTFVEQEPGSTRIRLTL